MISLWLEEPCRATQRKQRYASNMDVGAKKPQILKPGFRDLTVDLKFCRISLSVFELWPSIGLSLKIYRNSIQIKRMGWIERSDGGKSDNKQPVYVWVLFWAGDSSNSCIVPIWRKTEVAFSGSCMRSFHESIAFTTKQNPINTFISQEFALNKSDKANSNVVVGPYSRLMSLK